MSVHCTLAFVLVVVDDDVDSVHFFYLSILSWKLLPESKNATLKISKYIDFVLAVNMSRMFDFEQMNWKSFKCFFFVFVYNFKGVQYAMCASCLFDFLFSTQINTWTKCGKILVDNILGFTSVFGIRFMNTTIISCRLADLYSQFSMSWFPFQFVLLECNYFFLYASFHFHLSIIALQILPVLPSSDSRSTCSTPKKQAKLRKNAMQYWILIVEI